MERDDRAVGEVRSLSEDAVLRRLSITRTRDALRLGVLVWLGFQAMEVLGSVLHEHCPFGLYLLHVGDALMTTLITALILGRKVA